MRENPNIRYVGVDLNHTFLGIGKALQVSEDVRAGHAPNERIHYVNATGGALPFADNSVSELVLKNVLGHDKIWDAVRMLVLYEAGRVLKQGGLLKIIEQYTPDVARNDIREYLSAMRDGSLGFEQVDEGSEPRERDFDSHMYESPDAAPSSFILRFQKRPTVS